MEIQCSQCDKPNPADSTFCGYCGAPLTPEVIPTEATTTESLQSPASAESQVPQEAAPEAWPGATREPTPETVLPLEEIKNRVLGDMQQDTMAREMRKYLTRIKSQSYIKILDPSFEGMYDPEYFEG